MTMSIEKNWKKAGVQTDEQLASMLQPGLLKKWQSTNPLQKIKKNLLINIGYAIVIALIYVYIIYLFPYWQIIFCIGVVLGFTVWAAMEARILYKQIQQNNTSANSLLFELEYHYHNIKKWMHLQQKVAVIVYPFAATGGFLIGGMEGSGKSIEYLLNKPAVWATLLVALVILVPSCWLLARWMFQKSFGKYLDMLKDNIHALKQA